MSDTGTNRSDGKTVNGTPSIGNPYPLDVSAPTPTDLVPADLVVQAPVSVCTAIDMLPTISVSGFGKIDGNVLVNAVDNDISARWSS